MLLTGVVPRIAARIRVPPGQRKKESGVHLNDQRFWLCRVAPRERGVFRFDADAAPFFWRGPMKLCERL
jgi:hypothetical protein